MDKYIGFDIDCKKTVVCVVESGKKDIYRTLGPDIGSMKKFRKPSQFYGRIDGGWVFASCASSDCARNLKMFLPWQIQLATTVQIRS